MLGAQGALIGTRFYAAHESLGHPEAKRRICEARGDETQRTRVFDLVRGLAWPDPYSGRALHNPFMDRWHGRETELTDAGESERARYRAAARQADFDTAVIWAGESVDLIEALDSAAALVERISAEAVACLRSAARLAAA